MQGGGQAEGRTNGRDCDRDDSGRRDCLCVHSVPHLLSYVLRRTALRWSDLGGELAIVYACVHQEGVGMPARGYSPVRVGGEPRRLILTRKSKGVRAGGSVGATPRQGGV